MSSILLIDDEEQHANELQLALEQRLAGRDITVEVWSPSAIDTQPDQRFIDLVQSKNTLMVVTDYDLTSRQLTGFFGSTVVDWCKRFFIPVGDYSRGNALRQLPKEPDQYEIRVPTVLDEAAVYVEAVALGFDTLRKLTEASWPELRGKRSPAAILATLLGRPFEETRFASYSMKIASANAALLSELHGRKVGQDAEGEIKAVLPYILGHLLLNVILRFPGPILHEDALAGLLAIRKEDVDVVIGGFESAKYTGPFSELCRYFWTSAVENQLNEYRSKLEAPIQGQTQGEINRKTLGAVYEREFAHHACTRCDGLQGGFFCPFQKRPVCLRPDCSVVTNAWVPQGARLCRIEKDFYDEWAPLLGF